MKDVKICKLVYVALLMVIAPVIMVACGNWLHTDNPQPLSDTEIVENLVQVTSPTSEEPTPQSTSPPVMPIPLNEALRIFNDVDAVLDRDDGELWGFRLNAPIVFTCFDTRFAVANQPDLEGILQPQDGMYIGYVPEGINLSPRSIRVLDYFGGVRWITIPWEAMHLFPGTTSAWRNTAIVHYQIHWYQTELFGNDAFEIWATRDNSHMYEEFARISIRLEANALMRALQTEGNERVAAVTDALSIRTERDRIFGRRTEEAKLEMNEGLAVYAELLMPAPPGTDAHIQGIYWRVLDLRQSEAMQFGFGYTTGALYAFLLHESGVSWKPHLTVHSDLSIILKDALGITQLPAFNQIDLSLYGYETISEEEREWVKARTNRIQDLFTELENYPQLRFYAGDYEHYTSSILMWRWFTVPDLGMIATGDGDYIGSFGHLHIHNRYNDLIHSEGVTIVIAHDIEISENQVTTRNWVLNLNEGYQVVPHYGNFRIARIDEVEVQHELYSMFQSVLLNERQFYSKWAGFAYLNEYNHELVGPTTIAIFDMNGDGIPEVIANFNDTIKLVLHYYSGEIFGSEFGIRCLNAISTDGRFFLSPGGAGNFGIGEMMIDGETAQILTVYDFVGMLYDRHYPYETHINVRSGVSISNEEFEIWWESLNDKELISWHTFSRENIQNLVQLITPRCTADTPPNKIEE